MILKKYFFNTKVVCQLKKQQQEFYFSKIIKNEEKNKENKFLKFIKEENKKKIFNFLKNSKIENRNVKIELTKYFVNKNENEFDFFLNLFKISTSTTSPEMDKFILNYFEKKKKFERMISYFDEFIVDKDDVSIHFFGKILGICANLKKILKSEEIYEKMKIKKIEPNEIILTTIIKGYLLNNISKIG